MIVRHALRRVLGRLRVVARALLPLAAVMCLNDRPNGPAIDARASLRVGPVARNTTVCGTGPTFTLARARVLLRTPNGTDSNVVVETFIGDTAKLVIGLPLAGVRTLLDVTAEAIDGTNDTLFRATDTVTVTQGALTTVNYLRLWYAAPDSGLHFLTVAPRDTIVRFNGSYDLRATGADASAGAITAPIHLGYLTRDPTIATVGPDGTILAQAKAGSTWIVGSSWLGVCDSTTVVVVPPVASVTVTPDTAVLVRDGTLQLVAVTKDAAGKTLLGRAVRWSSNNANASVDTAGLVRALVANKSARITATSEGVSASAGIGVLPKPVGKVTITPKTAITNVGLTTPLSAVAYDSTGAVNLDYPIAWTALDPTFASVTATGVVTGVAVGAARISATANGSADTATITVNAAGITSTVVTPTPDTLIALADSLLLTATAYTGATPTTGTFRWLSRDPTIATVDQTGRVIAAGNGTTYVVAIEAGGTLDSARVTVNFILFASLSGGGLHTCGVSIQGVGYCWGHGTVGELGNGGTASSAVPVIVSGGLSFDSISAGSAPSTGEGFTCGITKGGAAYCWGYNSNGQLGNNSTANSSAPVAVAGGHTFLAVSSGQLHACGITIAGDAYCWGANNYGQLGNADLTGADSHVPVLVAGGLSFSSISVGADHSCGVSANGLYCWGRNVEGELGDKVNTNSPAPVPVSWNGTLTGVAAGEYHSCAIASLGTVECWGWNANGQLGDGTVANSNVPVTVNNQAQLPFASIQGGLVHSCTLTDKGQGYCWGSNSDRALGNGDASGASQPFPVPVVGGLTFASLTTGGHHTCALTLNGTAYCWGLNNYGQLATRGGTTAVPTKVRAP
jgi:alpha-tubulin suppressor-like RCC1 family protein